MLLKLITKLNHSALNRCHQSGAATAPQIATYFAVSFFFFLIRNVTFVVGVILILSIKRLNETETETQSLQVEALS